MWQRGFRAPSGTKGHSVTATSIATLLYSILLIYDGKKSTILCRAHGWKTIITSINNPLKVELLIIEYARGCNQEMTPISPGITAYRLITCSFSMHRVRGVAPYQFWILQWFDLLHLVWLKLKCNYVTSKKSFTPAIMYEPRQTQSIPRSLMYSEFFLTYLYGWETLISPIILPVNSYIVICNHQCLLIIKNFFPPHPCYFSLIWMPLL